ncbi:uncharacterized protein RJT21DRAFT_120583 [Scheffersomyces amazonensis]|uniref:uncharacterized protein n=1 Tax=Scheffersomyces amazonensis TaxID=1078765 RepID=UPI00315DA714
MIEIFITSLIGDSTEQTTNCRIFSFCRYLYVSGNTLVLIDSNMYIAIALRVVPLRQSSSSYVCRTTSLVGCVGVRLTRRFHISRPLNFNPIVDNIIEELKNDDDDKNSKNSRQDKSNINLKDQHQNQQRRGQGQGQYQNQNQNQDESRYEKFKIFIIKCLETMGITISSISILGVAGFLYHKFYNIHVLDKMNDAFEMGDPAAQLAIHKRTHDDNADSNEYWVERPQQKQLDDIINGTIIGRYFLLVGEKGTGKTSLILESMKKVGGYNVTIFDAHADPEIFRIRLGKALNFAYNEDYIGSLFSIRGPRDTTALLDIERAFSKLEELAIRRVQKIHKPLIVIINNAHLIKENEEGIKLLELLQQKAEGLSGSGLVTILFNSDDYWVYEKLKKLGTRLELINVRDFNRKETISSLKYIRHKYFRNDPQHQLTDEICHQIYDLIGGRPQHITQVARHRDIIRACHEIIDREKTWFLNQCGLLGEAMDDDVMESGKFSTSAMLLMKEFVKMDRERMNTLITDSGSDHSRYRDHQLPELPLWRSRQIMTRNDYIQQYDNLNIFTIDSESRVRADSVPMMRAFHEIASQPHFESLLEDTIQRVADIESLGRTREIVAKDLNLGSHYQISKKTKDEFEVKLRPSEKEKRVHGDFETLREDDDDDCDDEDDDLYMEDIDRRDTRKWWKRRMKGFDQTYSAYPSPTTTHPEDDHESY